MTIKDLFAPGAWRLDGASVRRAAMMLLMCMLTMTVQTAWAETATTYYVDATGTRHENFTATVLTGGGATTLAPGWYVVNSDVTYTGTVTLDGDVTIILANGCTMNIGTSETRVTGSGIKCSSHNLTIYGQTLDEDKAGQLEIYISSSSHYNYAGIFILSGTYTQHSGNVTINSYSNNAINVYGDITINGGKLDATATALKWDSNDVIALAGSNITMTGGILNATGIRSLDSGNSADGIYCTTFTLGWRKASDRFTASSFLSGTVTIADGQAFTTDGTDIYSGTLSSSDKTAIKGKTLVPYGMTVAAKEATVDGQTNYWTTLYRGDAGFAIDAEENACAYTATYEVVNEVGTITLHRLGKVIPKGTAVIIVGEDASIDMTVSNAEAEYTVENDLHGVDVETSLANVKSAYSADAILVLSNMNEHFGFHELAMNVPARKAFLALSGTTPLARGLTMTFGDDATGIQSIDHSPFTIDHSAGAWYSLDGRRLNGKPTAKGLYIVGGKKVIVK